MSDIDPRPRPQYGEYATPEEQQARIQRPEVTEALEAGQAPQPEKPAPVASAASPAAPLGRGARIDRGVTFGLLIYGLITVITTIPQLLDFPTTAETLAERMGATDTSFTNLGAGFVLGAVAAAIYGIGWLATAALTWRRLKRGRISFWVPLAGFAVTTFLASIVIMFALLGDPGFIASLSGAFGV
ncbi:DUF6264 family protein [Microbacterium sp. HMH0099]|uniref:DUF6264 family protein n=1 Tax=Microbacterium TaxID=33882 RepID=UPI0036DF6F86